MSFRLELGPIWLTVVLKNSNMGWRVDPLASLHQFGLKLMVKKKGCLSAFDEDFSLFWLFINFYSGDSSGKGFFPTWMYFRLQPLVGRLKFTHVPPILRSSHSSLLISHQSFKTNVHRNQKMILFALCSMFMRVTEFSLHKKFIKFSTVSLKIVYKYSYKIK